MEQQETKQKSPGKSRRAKRRRKSPLVIVLIILLLGVMGFSAYKIIDQLLIYKRGQDAYNELREQVVQTIIPPSRATPTTAWTVPAVEPSASFEESTVETTSREANASPTDDERGDITYDPNETDSGKMQVVPWLNVDFNLLSTINPSIKAWLWGMDGIVNYPVVQGEDNEYYNHRLLDGTERFCGTLFVDYRNDFLKDDITYIYGHKMKDGTMFGHFGKYDTYEYYQTHPTFVLYTPDEIYDLQVITCVYTTVSEPLYFNFQDEEEFNWTIEDFYRRGQFRSSVELQYGDKLVSLWTCAYYREDGRMFVICKAVKRDQ